MRTQMVLGEEALNTLKSSKVAVFGIGGVGSYTVEALVRTGVGELHIFDSDTVEETNLNRQLIATANVLGEDKVSVAEKRLKEINPDVKITANKVFYSPENAQSFDLAQYDYIVDAIDSIPSKAELILRAKECNVPIISSMGTGNKKDPTLFKVSDIYKTEGCPLARAMRYELKKRGIKSLKTVYSPEKPVKPQEGGVGSLAFVTGTAGLIIAAEVIKDLTNGQTVV